mmetsp:Transcript_5131/g.10497  ORF Transcript_5131/g.10497 Transcript_5131/m.10497 type:complete len:92 (-) Transcript_5131:1278-1553(-)
MEAEVGSCFHYGGEGGKDAEAADKLVGHFFHDVHDDNYFEFGGLAIHHHDDYIETGNTAGLEAQSLADWSRVAYQEHQRCDYMDGAAGLWE